MRDVQIVVRVIDYVMSGEHWVLRSSAGTIESLFSLFFYKYGFITVRIFPMMIHGNHHSSIFPSIESPPASSSSWTATKSYGPAVPYAPLMARRKRSGRGRHGIAGTLNGFVFFRKFWGRKAWIFPWQMGVLQFFVHVCSHSCLVKARLLMKPMVYPKGQKDNLALWGSVAGLWV